MDKKFGYYIFGGMLIGALLGLSWFAARNALVGLGSGALIGTFVGWFVAAYVFQKKENK